MAEHVQQTADDATPGTMDISDHVKMWLTFWSMAKWSAGLVILIAAMLAIFRTHNG
jgi:hypothetical protein